MVSVPNISFVVSLFTTKHWEQLRRFVESRYTSKTPILFDFPEHNVRVELLGWSIGVSPLDAYEYVQHCYVASTIYNTYAP